MRAQYTLNTYFEIESLRVCRAHFTFFDIPIDVFRPLSSLHAFLVMWLVVGRASAARTFEIEMVVAAVGFQAML
jgi:hypothetical protein